MSWICGKCRRVNHKATPPCVYCDASLHQHNQTLNQESKR